MIFNGGNDPPATSHVTWNVREEVTRYVVVQNAHRNGRIRAAKQTITKPQYAQNDEQGRMAAPTIAKPHYSHTRHDWVTALRNVLVGVGHMLQEPVTGAMLGEGISKIVSTGDFDNADFAPGYQVLNP